MAKTVLDCTELYSTDSDEARRETLARLLALAIEKAMEAEDEPC